jgi:hypothetical protein
VAIGVQEIHDNFAIGDCPSGLNRTAQAAVAGPVLHGMALAVGSGLFPNRPDQDPQANHGRQGPQQAGPGSLQGPCGPGHGERRPQQGQARGLMFAH